MKTRALLIACSLLAAANAFSQNSFLTGLVAFWPLQSTNGITTPDVVGGYDFTLSGIGGKVPTIVSSGSPASHQNGEPGKTMQFSAANFESCQYFARLSDNLPVNKNPQFTVAFWVNALATNNANNVAVFSESLNTNDSLYAFNGTPLFTFGMDSGGFNNTTDFFGRFFERNTFGVDGTAQSPPITRTQTMNATSSNVFDGQWHFVVLTMDTNGIYRVYVDGSFDHGSGGALDAQGHPTALQSLPLTNTVDNSRWLWDLDTTGIGGNCVSTPAVSTFNGMMDNVAVWNRALATNEVTSLYINGLSASYTITINQGWNAIANQLNHGSNALSDFLTHVQDGDLAFLASSNGTASDLEYEGGTGWIDLDAGSVPTNGPVLAAGAGMFVYNGNAPYNQTFSGTPQVAVLPVSLNCGSYTLLCRQKNGAGTFENVTGLTPQDGDQVFIYTAVGRATLGSPTSSDYTPYVFCGGAWLPTTPFLNVGQPAYFRRCCSNSCVSVSQNDILITSSTPAMADFGPGASDGCGANVTVYCRPPPGSLFQPGTTPVHCVALSDDGYVASCDFNIIVTPPPLQAPTGNYTINIHTGFNLIAYQFDSGGNTLGEIMPDVPAGVVLSKFDNSTGQWIQSVFDGNLGAWMPPFTLKPGEGAFLDSPVDFMLYMQGDIHGPNLPISLSNSISLVSRQTDAVGNFTNITGLAPTAGDNVYKWNGTGYDTYSFDGTNWLPFEPSNNVGEAWWIATASATPPPIPLRPTITGQSPNKTATQGSSVILTVSASGDAPFTYQWRLNGNAINGATASQYVINSLQPPSCGNYDVLVQNLIGITNSAIATVGIAGAPTLPFNNTFASAGTLSSTTSGLGVTSNVGATPESGEPNPGFIPGGAPVWVTWTAPATGVATFSTAGSGFDTLIGIYTGASLPSLTPVAFDDDSAGYLWGMATFNAVSGITYDIQVDGFYGASGNVLLSWSEIVTSSQIPVITSQPVSQTVAAGGAANFSVGVQSGQTVSFQWERNGVSIPGASGISYNVTNIGMGDVGAYQAILVNLVGGLTNVTFPAQLQINSAGGGQPANTAARSEDKFFAATDTTVRTNDPYDPAITTGYTGTQIFGIFGCSTDPYELSHCGAPCVLTSWTPYQAPSDGVLTVNDSGSSFSGVLAVYGGDLSYYPSITPVACSAGHAAGTEVVSFAVYNGNQYWLMVGATNNADANGTAVVSYSLATAPVFTLLPVSQSVTLNTPVTLTATATGSPSPTYQWMRNGVPVASTTTVLSLGPLQSTLQGNYTIIAANTFGTNIFNYTPVYLNSPLRLTNTTDNNGILHTQVIGVPNSNYIIQASPYPHNVPANWIPKMTNSSGTGVIDYYDSVNTATNLFYRAELQPAVH